MAMDQATSTAAKYGLPQSDCESLTSEAVARAESVDACTLCWDAESSTYQLIHPTLANGSPQIFSIVVEGDASLATVTNGKGRIDLLSPTDPTLSLVSLDFASKSLTINAHALTTHHPSLYIVDVSVIAILAVACFESRRSSRDTPIFSAPPTIADVEQVRGIDGWKLGSKSKSNVIQKYTEDKRLPKTTRGVLKVISWTFMVLVWVLTLLVEGLAKVVVGVSKVAEKA